MDWLGGMVQARLVGEPIPVTVVTGFLGAGKSTLVERWLSELPRDETAVIVNEQGDIGIDGALLAARTSRLREVTGGCICCVTQAQLAAALNELANAHPAPRRILVETSGAASPAGVIRAMTRGESSSHLRLDGVITVVDVRRTREVLGFDLAVEQVSFADVIVISHVDQAGDLDLDLLEAALVRHAPGAVIAHAHRGTVVGGDTKPLQLVELLAQREEALRIPENLGSDHTPIDAVGLSLGGELDEERFGDWVERALGAAEARILRVKGILAIKGTDKRVIVQGVGEAIEITLGAEWGHDPRNSRLVVLGLGLDAASLEAGFTACATGAQ